MFVLLLYTRKLRNINLPQKLETSELSLRHKQKGFGSMEKRNIVYITIIVGRREGTPGN